MCITKLLGIILLGTSVMAPMAAFAYGDQTGAPAIDFQCQKVVSSDANSIKNGLSVIDLFGLCRREIVSPAKLHCFEVVMSNVDFYRGGVDAKGLSDACPIDASWEYSRCLGFIAAEGQSLKGGVSLSDAATVCRQGK